MPYGTPGVGKLANLFPMEEDPCPLIYRAF